MRRRGSWSSGPCKERGRNEKMGHGLEGNRPTRRRREKGEEGKRKGPVGLRVGPVGLSSFSSHYFWIHSASSKSFDT